MYCITLDALFQPTEFLSLICFSDCYPLFPLLPFLQDPSQRVEGELAARLMAAAQAHGTGAGRQTQRKQLGGAEGDVRRRGRRESATGGGGRRGRGRKGARGGAGTAELMGGDVQEEDEESDGEDEGAEDEGAEDEGVEEEAAPALDEDDIRAFKLRMAALLQPGECALAAIRCACARAGILLSVFISASVLIPVFVSVLASLGLIHSVPSGPTPFVPTLICLLSQI